MKIALFELTKAAVVLGTALAVGACDTKKDGDSATATANAYGCVVPGQTMVNGVCPYPNGAVNNSFVFQQAVTVTDPATYRRFLVDLYFCPNNSRCPVNYMTVRLDLFSSTLPAQGNVSIGNGYGPALSKMDYARPIQGGFEFRVRGKYGTPSYNDVVRVVALVVDNNLSAVDVTVYYNDVAFAAGRVNRIPMYYY